MALLQTMASLTNALYALVLHSGVQTRARAELDSVIGRDRLPDLKDRDQLPYVTAICWEIFRWKVAAPLGVSHATSEDDVYKGLFIPKGILKHRDEQMT